MTLKRQFAIAVLGVLGLGLFSATAASPDRLMLRDGSAITGRVLSEANGVYTVQDARTRSTRPVRKTAVRFVIYGEAPDSLGLEEARAGMTDATPAAIRVLPAPAYRDAVLEAVKGAKKYIYATTYSLSSINSGETGDFFAALRERAAAGVKVYVIAPAGSGTQAGVKIAALNAAEDLSTSGVQVRFLTKNAIQHKKLVIVDTRLAFVGSSNLTSAGFGDNLELNIATEAPAFVAEAVADFRSLQRSAKSPHEVSF